MIIPDWVRLSLYVTMAILPVWQDFFTKSTDYSFRGMMMPMIASAAAAVTVILARTKSRMDPPAEAPTGPVPPVPPVQAPPLRSS